MTDVPAMISDRAAPTREVRVGAIMGLYAVVASALVAGIWAGTVFRGPAASVDPQLVVLLRFMASMKLAGMLGALALVHWRLTRAASFAMVGLYIGSVGAMAIAPGLIWSLTAIAYAALSFHAGLLMFLATAWSDDGAPARALPLMRLLRPGDRPTTIAMGTTAERHR